MPIENDPLANEQARRARQEAAPSNTAIWVATAAAAMLVLGVIVYATSDNNPGVATNDRPTATTTGSAPTGSAPKAPAESLPNRGDAGSSPVQAPAAR